MTYVPNRADLNSIRGDIVEGARLERDKDGNERLVLTLSHRRGRRFLSREIIIAAVGGFCSHDHEQTPDHIAADVHVMEPSR